MTAAELLRLVRRRRGWSQKEMARRAGTSQPVVSAYERGRRDPTVTTLDRLVTAGGEKLRLGAGPMPELPPAVDDAEHGRRLLDVLSLADAIPHRLRPAELSAPRIVSG